MRKNHDAPDTEENLHHLLWDRRTWNQTLSSRALREFWYCRIYIPTTLHQRIHRLVTYIPPPSPVLCDETLIQLIQLERHDTLHQSDSIDKRIKILIFCLDTGKNGTIKALKEQLDVIEHF